MTEADWDEVLHADLKAPFLLTQKLLPLLTSPRRASAASPAKILFLTSRAAFRGSYGAANYAAAKAGLIGLVKSLAAELGTVPVLVNAVNPGFMISGMTENLPDALKEIQRKASPLEKFSNPEEVADFMTYLVSDRMTQVTGQVFHFDSRSINF
jgi:3-oxoacyl-[acyl-carrier protein] reductase